MRLKMTDINPFEVLPIKPNFTPKEIKRTYKKYLLDITLIKLIKLKIWSLEKKLKINILKFHNL